MEQNKKKKQDTKIRKVRKIHSDIRTIKEKSKNKRGRKRKQNEWNRNNHGREKNKKKNKTLRD